MGVGGKTVSEGIRDEDVMRNGVEKKAEPMGERGKIEVAIAEGEKSEPVGKKERWKGKVVEAKIFLMNVLMITNLIE